MNKKQMRRLIQRREKRFDQNARAQDQAKARRAEMANFSVDVVEQENYSSALRLAFAENKTCYLCGGDFSEEEIAFQKFVALESKSKNFYFVHTAHVYEQDLETPLPEMQKNLTDAYMKIFETEKGYLFAKPINAETVGKTKGEKTDVR